MAVQTWPSSKPEVVYPDSDGEPMADNTLQFEWITRVKGGLDVLFADDPDVFVAGDLLWYPVQGDNQTRAAPDAMVAFGRPKGYRGSYKQWEENGIAPQVAFEILSPGNRREEMRRKLAFYELYGVEEYYEYDPYRFRLRGWRRQGNSLVPLSTVDGWVSPRLRVRFEIKPGRDLTLYFPDGRPFQSVVEMARERDQAEQERDDARRRVEVLVARLRALGLDPDAVNESDGQESGGGAANP